MKFTDCKTASALLEFLDNDAHALSHKFYYHYTTFDIIKKIYRGKSIWLSQLCKTSNDICERKWYEEYGKTSFSVCFSTGSTESIPLWYLYSSKKGVGARLIISKSQMKRLWNNLSFVLAEIDGNKEIVLGSEIPLGKEDYRVAFRDILYVSRANKASCDHQRNDKSGIIRYNNDLLRISSDEIRAVTQSYMKFVKNQIWFYEKESLHQGGLTTTRGPH